MIWPSFRAVSSAACLSASACFNLHTQTKAGDTNMQNKKKKNDQNKLWQKHLLVYMCTSLYSRWNRTYWNIKMDKRTWFFKYNNLWKIKKITIFGLKIDFKFLITTWKNCENLSSSQTHYYHISSWCLTNGDTSCCKTSKCTTCPIPPYRQIWLIKSQRATFRICAHQNRNCRN